MDEKSEQAKKEQSNQGTLMRKGEEEFYKENPRAKNYNNDRVGKTFVTSLSKPLEDKSHKIKSKAMAKPSQSQTGDEMLISSLEKSNQPVTLLNYLSIAGIDLPLDNEQKAQIEADFPQWAGELRKLNKPSSEIQ